MRISTSKSEATVLSRKKGGVLIEGREGSPAPSGGDPVSLGLADTKAIYCGD